MNIGVHPPASFSSSVCHSVIPAATWIPGFRLQADTNSRCDGDPAVEQADKSNNASGNRLHTRVIEARRVAAVGSAVAASRRPLADRSDQIR
jgi:hypothetical protein